MLLRNSLGNHAEVSEGTFIKVIFWGSRSFWFLLLGADSLVVNFGIFLTAVKVLLANFNVRMTRTDNLVLDVFHHDGSLFVVFLLIVFFLG